MTGQGSSETFLIYGQEYKCPGCGCWLSAYEVFACRLRSLTTPVCLGCLAMTVKWLKDALMPLVESLALKALEK